MVLNVSQGFKVGFQTTVRYLKLTLPRRSGSEDGWILTGGRGCFQVMMLISYHAWPQSPPPKRGKKKKQNTTAD